MRPRIAPGELTRPLGDWTVRGSRMMGGISSGRGFQRRRARKARCILTTARRNLPMGPILLLTTTVRVKTVGFARRSLARRRGGYARRSALTTRLAAARPWRCAPLRSSLTRRRRLTRRTRRAKVGDVEVRPRTTTVRLRMKTRLRTALRRRRNAAMSRPCPRVSGSFGRTTRTKGLR